MKKLNLFLCCILPFCIGINAQKMVKNIDPLKSYHHIQNIVSSGNLIYFIANDSVHGNELWRTYGDEQNTSMIKDISVGVGNGLIDYNVNPMIAFQDKLFFVANDGINGGELWVSAGSAINTYMLADINKNVGSGSNIKHFFVFKNHLYFSAYDPNVGNELYRTDGTAQGTVLVKNINPIPGANGSSSPQYFTAFNDELYFRATDGSTGAQIWKTDGTEAGTVRVSGINTGLTFGGSPQRLTVSGDKLYFVANDTVNGVSDLELWATDGTEAGTKLVKNIRQNASSVPANLMDYNGNLYFKADDGIHGEELWRSDGTEQGTVLVKDINTSGHGINYNSFLVYKNELYFIARGTGLNWEIWKTNGTSNGTVQVTNLNVQGNSNPNTLYLYGNTIYFRAIYGQDGSNAYELFKTDGTSQGTTLTSNICKQQHGDAKILYFATLNGELYFEARDTIYGSELWKLTAITYSDVSKVVCDTFKFLDSVYTTEGIHSYYLANNAGYDSLITIDLTLVQAPTITQQGDSLVTVLGISYQWYLNGVKIDGETNRAIKPSKTGNYSVMVNVMYKKGETCEKISNEFNVSNVSVTLINKGNVKLYPNPANTYIEIESSEKINNIKIYNLLGVEMLTSTQNIIVVDHLQKGVYLIKINTEKGIIDTRFVIQ